jgi:DNA end-binding protein Ku
VPRSMWKGAIQFGLVTIPVKMYLATESRGISFNMLHAACHGRIQMKTYCPTDDTYIERSDTVRGYEVSPGQYVVVTDQDLEAVPLKTVRAIEIEQFVRAEDDGAATRFVKQAYYLEPDPVARKAFYLLKQVLSEQGLHAIAKIVLRDREQLAAIDAFGPAMLLSTLHWPDEIRSTAELNLPEAEVEVKPAEKMMAEQLIAAMTHEFDPSAYRDEYRQAVLSIVEAKAEGAEVVHPVEQPATKVTDLMAALEASVAAATAARTKTRQEPEAVGAKAGSSPAQAGSGEQRPEQPVQMPEPVPARRRKSA